MGRDSPTSNKKVTQEKGKWEKAAHIAGVVALILALLNVYYTHLKGAKVLFRNFPLSAYGGRDVEKPLEFRFFLYNSGRQAAFIEDTAVWEILGAGEDYPHSAEVNPEGDYIIQPGETVEVLVSVPHPRAVTTKMLQVHVWLDRYGIFSFFQSSRIKSKVLIAKWA